VTAIIQCRSLAQISMIATLKRKEVDDVLGGENAWKNVQKTDGEPLLIPSYPYQDQLRNCPQ